MAEINIKIGPADVYEKIKTGTIGKYIAFGGYIDWEFYRGAEVAWCTLDPAGTRSWYFVAHQELNPKYPFNQRACKRVTNKRIDNLMKRLRKKLDSKKDKSDKEKNNEKQKLSREKVAEANRKLLSESKCEGNSPFNPLKKSIYNLFGA